MNRLPVPLRPLAALAVLPILAPAPVRAQAPAAIYYSNVAGSSANQCILQAPYPFSCALDISNPGFQYVASALTSGGLLPAADLAHEGSGDTSAGNTLSASAAVRYFVFVRALGNPPPGTTVPLRVRSVGELTVTSSKERLFSEGSITVLGQGEAAIAENGTETRDLALDLVVPAVANQPFEIVIEARLRVLGSSADFGPWSFGGQAVIDPEVTIDPAFPDADQYVLEFSENLWAVFLDGFENGGTTRWSETSP